MAALTEEQSILRDQARAWVGDRAPVSAFRQMRDGGVEAGFEPKTWAEIVELGWTGVIVPEAYGGSDLGFFAMGLVLEEMGRELAAAPLFASGLVGASALLLAGDDAQKQAYLPKVVSGAEILTLAIDEGPRHRPEHTALQAERTGSGFRLTGGKSLVLEGMAATTFVLAARTDGAPGEREGISLFLVPATAAGLARTPMRAIDSRGYARLAFDRVEIGADALLGQLDGGYAALEAVLDRARAGLGADMLGVGGQAFDMTLDYLKTRKQFGQVIGGFQALGHRAATLYSAMELARSCVEAALQALDEEASDVAELASLSKAKAGEFLYDMSNQLIQIHGGIGMTDEFDAGLYLKRARVLEATYGNRAFHRDRYATLLGF